MTHALKTYTLGDLTCDMRSSRKQFFPIYLGDKQVADIEKGSYTALAYNLSDEDLWFNFNILNGLDEDTYSDIFQLLSQITKENNIEKIQFSSTDEFPKYRRQKKDEDSFIFADGREKTHGISKDDFLKYMRGHFMIIEYENRKIIIDKQTYIKLHNEGLNIKPPLRTLFPRILVGGEKIACDNRISYIFSVDDTHILDKVHFENHDSENGMISFYFYIDNFDKNAKIPLPKITSKNNKIMEVDITFYDRFTKEQIKINKEQLDFKNIENYDSIKVADNGYISFNIDKAEPKHEQSFDINNF